MDEMQTTNVCILTDKTVNTNKIELAKKNVFRESREYDDDESKIDSHSVTK